MGRRALATQCLHDLRPERRHVAGPRGQDNVAGTRGGDQFGHGRVSVHEAPAGTQVVGDQLAGDAGDRIFAGRVDVQDQGGVREVQGFCEFPGKLPGPGEEVRLEEDVDLVVTGDGPGCRQGGPYLGGVVGVVVEDTDTAGLPLQLKAP